MFVKSVSALLGKPHFQFPLVIPEAQPQFSKPELGYPGSSMFRRFGIPHPAEGTA